MSQSQTRPLIWAAVLLGGVAHAARADDQTAEAKFRKALEQVAEMAALGKRGADLQTQAAKATSDEEKKRLQTEIANLRKTVEEMDSAVRKAMEELAPTNKKGYGRAHLWLVERMYRMERTPEGKEVPPSPETVLNCERHLLFAIGDESESVQMAGHFYLSRLYRDTNRIEDAKKHLTVVAKKHPEYRLVLAQWAKQEGDRDSIPDHAKAAEAAFRERLQTNQADHEARFGLIESLLLQSKFEEGETVLKSGATLAQTRDLIQAYAKKNTRLLVAWAEDQERLGPSGAPERLRLLESAFELAPDDPEVFNRLLKLSKEKTPEADKVRQIFRRLTEGDKPSVMALLFVGIDAWEHGKHDDARNFWEKAIRLTESNPLLNNNLGWSLAFPEAIDLPRALDLANRAVAGEPKEPRFRGTRGHILAKMKRYKEALPDLEASKVAYPDSVELFDALSEVSEKLGHSVLASEYKKKANELRERQKKSKPTPQAGK